jgi:cellulose synthase (UDP-forming)
MANVAWLAVHLAIAVPFIVAASPSRAPRSAPLVPAPFPSLTAAAGSDRATARPTPSVEPALQPAHD